MNNFKKIIKMIIRIPSIIEIGIIIFYQKYISKYLGSRCRFYPTCSEYARQAIDKYGIIKGNVLLILRILKCHPFSKGGIDYLK